VFYIERNCNGDPATTNGFLHRRCAFGHSTPRVIRPIASTRKIMQRSSLVTPEIVALAKGMLGHWRDWAPEADKLLFADNSSRRDGTDDAPFTT
jgi:hypothetical protein